ncbi:hypothetical protein Tco_1066718 [Tanacetum coccineum]|uniref:Retrovirus-related Pol polyprotein from transposon TNT 1-94-like beta-barrel domain-containing protein n=1 Tax=Tanacetum coccineum TaxID=301880 RepID=A0ABQ5HC80_9ASTR
MYTFSPMMVANSRNHHCRVRPYTREVLVISTNLDIQKNHYPLDFTNRRGTEARIKNTWYNQGYCRDHLNGAEENLNNATSSGETTKDRDCTCQEQCLNVTKNKQRKKHENFVMCSCMKSVIILIMINVIAEHKIECAFRYARRTFSVVQIVLWVVDNGCSKHMTGDRSLLRNFVEKFMGTVRFGNDNFAAINSYG